ncbi:MAG: glycosyltransferase [Desulfobulbaceae bacterium]|jgi:glycosyltransferase involved in cell wall biosynthesis|nr:glycosyltransferase [Desulfobulbaceae bacterium]
MDFRGTYKGGGGPDKTILNSAARHDHRRVKVLVAYLKNPHDEEFQITRMAEERGLDFVALADRRILDWRCLLELRRLIREHGIQVLHTHDDKTLLYGVLLRIMRPGLRLMHTCHSHADYGRQHFAKAVAWYKFRCRELFVLALMRCHHKPILTISDNTKKRLIHSGLRPEWVAVMPNGIDVGYWRRQNAVPILRREFGLRDEQMLVGTVARITFDKDLPTFYEVVSRVVRHRPNTVFAIVGDGYGDELDEARNQIERRGLDGVIRLTGHRTDLLNIYRSFDLFLMTSLTEGMPNTVLEAMALEVPIISTRVGGVPELIEEGQCGLLASIGDAEALAAAVLSLLDDEQRRRQLGQAARARVEEKFDFAKRVAALETYYCQFASY